MARPLSPPRVAVVDGTHLCLLPPPTSPNENSEANRSGAPTNAPTNGDPPPVVIPAVSLRSVPLFLSRRCRPLSSLRGKSLTNTVKNVEKDGSDGGEDDGDDDETDGGDEDEPAVIRMPLHLSGPLAACHSVEPPLRSGSRLAQTSLDSQMLASARPLNERSGRESGGSDDDDEGTVRLIAPPERGRVGSASEYGGRTVLEVDNGGAGCFVADFCGLGGFDQVLFLPPMSPRVGRQSAAGKRGGGENDDDDGDDNDKSSLKQDEALLRMTLRCSVLTDGTGVLFPRREDRWTIGDQSVKSGFHSALSKKCGRPRIYIRPVKSIDGDDDTQSWRGGEKKKRNRRKDKTERETDGSKKQKVDVSKHGKDGAPKHLTGSAIGDGAAVTKGACSGRENEKKTKGRWAAVLEKGMRTRLAREERIRSEAQAARDERARLAVRSQRALETFIAATSSPPLASVSASSAENGSIAGNSPSDNSAPVETELPQLQMLRMRYGVQPGGAGSASFDASTDNCPGGMSILIHAEIDVMYRDQPRNENGKDKTEATAAGDNPIDATADLRELHLAFSPAPCPCADTLSVSTRSGVVPAIRPGECVTIVALVELSGIRVPLDPSQSGASGMYQEDVAVALAINAHWKTLAKRDGDGVVENPRRRLRQGGGALGALRFPMESIVLPGSAGNRDGDEETDRHVDFAAASYRWPPAGAGIRPRDRFDSDSDSEGDGGDAADAAAASKAITIYDYRNPRVIEIDASRSADGGLGEWENLAASINAAAAFGNRVDIDRGNWGVGVGENEGEKRSASGDSRKIEGGMKLRLVILGRTPDERLALVQLVLRHMPESARILDPVEQGGAFPGEEERAAHNLMTCMRDELEGLERHRQMREEDFTTETLREMAELQRRTDDAASWIRRGWGDEKSL